MRRSIPDGIAFLTMLGLAAAAPSFASTFEAGVALAGTGACNPTLGPSPASGSWENFASGHGTTSASAFASGGSLGGQGVSASEGNSSNFKNQIGSCYEARVFIDDIVITGPGTDVPTTVSVDLSGIIESVMPLGGTATGRTVAGVQPQSVGGVGLTSRKQLDTGSVGNGATLNVATTLTSNVFTAPVNEPFAVELTVFGSVYTEARSSNGNPTVSNDFGSTLSFTQGGPVFDLPAGYTANSIDGGIVDNSFQTVTSVEPEVRTETWGMMKARYR